MKRAARIPPSALVLLVCLLLALALTWPMVAHFATHVPGDGIDDPSLAWNLWWAKHALVDQPQNPFDARWQFWPVGINLAFYTLTLLNGALEWWKKTAEVTQSIGARPLASAANALIALLDGASGRQQEALDSLRQAESELVGLALDPRLVNMVRMAIQMVETGNYPTL